MFGLVCRGEHAASALETYLVQEGEDVFSVVAKCGKSTQRMAIAEPAYASSAGGGSFPTGEIARTELSRYDRGSGSFSAIIKTCRWRSAINSLRDVAARRAAENLRCAPQHH